MRHESAPTPTTSDISSNAPGADDKIGFNDPTPGVWYILLDSKYVFSGVSIVADFKDRYVWTMTEHQFNYSIMKRLQELKHLRVSNYSSS